MLEGKALFVAVMMLTAAPIAATDQGQAFIGDVTYEIGEVFNGDEEDVEVVEKILEEADIEDKELLLTDEIIVVDCLTLEQYKELVNEREELLEQREDKEGARGEGKEDKKSDDKKESDFAKEEWVEKKEVIDEEACLSAEEWALKFESKEDKEEPCFTIDELENKLKDERKHHKKGWDRIRHDEEKDWDREEKDWDHEEKEWYDEEEFRSYLAELSEACDEGDEESCEELREVREELAADRDEEDEEREEREEEDEEHQEEDGSRSSDESECDEAREDEEKEFDEEACLTMEEWKEVIDEDKKEDEDRKDDENRKNQGPHRDAFVREIMEELGNACEEGNEEACVELEEMFAEVEEKEGGCDKERDDEEKDESEDEEEWEEGESDEETDEDESEQDESDDEEFEE